MTNSTILRPGLAGRTPKPAAPARPSVPLVGTEAEPTAEDEATVYTPKPLTPGSITAKALARVWSGSPITVVDSPPGAGKTTLVVNIVAHLTARADLRVLVVTVTRQQATALAHRLVEEVDPKYIEIAVKGLPAGTLPRGLYSATRAAGVKPAKVTVRTLASCALSAPSDYDVIVVDEAYQATYADVSLASAHIDQILLVGDPGQIGPVITVDTSIWRGMKDPPHGRAPEVLVTHEGPNPCPSIRPGDSGQPPPRPSPRSTRSPSRRRVLPAATWGPAATSSVRSRPSKFPTPTPPTTLAAAPLVTEPVGAAVVPAAQAAAEVRPTMRPAARAAIATMPFSRGRRSLDGPA